MPEARLPTISTKPVLERMIADSPKKSLAGSPVGSTGPLSEPASESPLASTSDTMVDISVERLSGSPEKSPGELPAEPLAKSIEPPTQPASEPLAETSTEPAEEPRAETVTEPVSSAKPTSAAGQDGLGREWSGEEDRRLLEESARWKHRVRWPLVADAMYKLGYIRTISEMKRRCEELLAQAIAVDKPSEPGPWTPAEDLTLLEATSRWGRRVRWRHVVASFRKAGYARTLEELRLRREELRSMKSEVDGEHGQQEGDVLLHLPQPVAGCSATVEELQQSGEATTNWLRIEDTLLLKCLRRSRIKKELWENVETFMLYHGFLRSRHACQVRAHELAARLKAASEQAIQDGKTPPALIVLPGGPPRKRPRTCSGILHHRWVDDEELLLKKCLVRREKSHSSWDQVAESMTAGGFPRTATACQQRAKKIREEVGGDSKCWMDFLMQYHSSRRSSQESNANRMVAAGAEENSDTPPSSKANNAKPKASAEAEEKTGTPSSSKANNANPKAAAEAEEKTGTPSSSKANDAKPKAAAGTVGESDMPSPSKANNAKAKAAAGAEENTGTPSSSKANDTKPKAAAEAVGESDMPSPSKANNAKAKAAAGAEENTGTPSSSKANNANPEVGAEAKEDMTDGSAQQPSGEVTAAEVNEEMMLGNNTKASTLKIKKTNTKIKNKRLSLSAKRRYKEQHQPRNAFGRWGKMSESAGSEVMGNMDESDEEGLRRAMGKRPKTAVENGVDSVMRDMSDNLLLRKDDGEGSRGGGGAGSSKGMNWEEAQGGMFTWNRVKGSSSRAVDEGGSSSGTQGNVERYQPWSASGVEKNGDVRGRRKRKVTVRYTESDVDMDVEMGGKRHEDEDPDWCMEGQKKSGAASTDKGGAGCSETEDCSTGGAKDTGKGLTKGDDVCGGKKKVKKAGGKKKKVGWKEAAQEAEAAVVKEASPLTAEEGEEEVVETEKVFKAGPSRKKGRRKTKRKKKKVVRNADGDVEMDPFCDSLSESDGYSSVSADPDMGALGEFSWGEG